MLRFRKGLVLGGLLIAPISLSACGPLISFGEDGPADTVYSLRYQGGFAHENASGPVVFVDEPSLAEGLNNDKIAVLLGNDRRMTLEGVRWSAPLSDLVRDYVIRALGHGSEARMVGSGGLDVRTNCRLGVKVWSMEYKPGNSATDDVVDVAIEASLVRLQDSKLLSKPTFVQSVRLNGSGDAAVMGAFNRAMTATATDMTRWFKAQLADCSVSG